MKNMKCLFFVMGLLLIFSCANRVVPGGGPKDLSPPELVSSEPEASGTDFSGNTITLHFNEYVQLKEVSKQLVVSPPLSSPPIVSTSGKTVQLTFEKLRDSTTYSFSFGNSISDISEGNILKDFRFVVATGNAVDSFSVSGMVVDALTNAPAKDVLAILYDSTMTDSMALMTNPAYFARSDENGKYFIGNLRSGGYRLFALQDKNANYILDPADEMAGFYGSILNIPATQTPVIRISKQPLSAQKILSSAFVYPSTIVTAFSRQAEDLDFRFDSIAPSRIFRSFSEKKDTITLHIFPAVNPPVMVRWFQNDTLIGLAEYSARQPKKEEASSKGLLIIKCNITSGSVLEAGIVPAFVSATPLSSFNPSKIHSRRDSTVVSLSYLPLTGDSTSLAFNIQASESGNYSIVAEPGAFIDIYGRQNDTTRFSLMVPEERTRGSVHYNFTGNDKNYRFLQMVSEKGLIVRSIPLQQAPEGIFSSVLPGVYTFRIVNDLNGNGRWDSGDFRHSIQPEPVSVMPGNTTVRANWEVEISIGE